jgi:hypothetical protein
MPELTRQRKITFGEMRAAGVGGLLIYCSDYRCAHSVEICADRWGDDLRLSDIEPLFTWQACGKKGADVRPDFDWAARRATESPTRAKPDHSPLAHEAWLIDRKNDSWSW